MKKSIKTLVASLLIFCMLGSVSLVSCSRTEGSAEDAQESTEHPSGDTTEHPKSEHPAGDSEHPKSDTTATEN